MPSAAKPASRNVWSLLTRVLLRARWELHKRKTNRRLAQGRVRSAQTTAPPILFLTPEAGVQPHLSAAATLARILHDRGQPVLMARCLNVFERCPAIDGAGVPFPATRPQKEQACYRCAENSIASLGALDLPTLDLREFNTHEIDTLVDKAVRELPPNLLDFHYDGIPFGKLTAHAISTLYKIASLKNLEPEIQARWVSQIRTSIRMYLLVDRIAKKTPLRAVAHYNDYPIFLAARLAARKHGVPVFNIGHASHRNLDRRRLMICPQLWSEYYRDMLATWPARRELALRPAEIDEVVNDLRSRLQAKGSHQYSPPAARDQAGLRKRLGIAEQRKLLVAYTSSLDESVAFKFVYDAMKFDSPRRSFAFPDQITWLRELIAWVSKREDVELVVRVHPREGRNKREGTRSHHLQLLQTEFENLPPRCQFIWPEEPISSYDLAELADLALISWSSIGMELARLGVPVVGWALDYSVYPDEPFAPWAPTPQRYFEIVEEYVRGRQNTVGDLIAAFRCYHWFHVGCGVDLGDIIPAADFERVPQPYRAPKLAELVETCFLQLKTPYELNWEEARRQQSPDGTRLERRALRQALTGFIHEYLTGEALAVSQESSFRVEGKEVEYHYAGKTYRRYSPLFSRLIRLLDSIT